MNKIGEYELIDHGANEASYFDGCGVCGTPFKNVQTGCGADPAGAIGDCLEQIACGGDWDTEDLEARIKAEKGWEDFPLEPFKCRGCSCEYSPEDIDCEGCEIYYYVSIRWNKGREL
jgi:hypothetical protein